MLASWANTIVISALGLGLGTAISLVRHFTPRELEEVMHSRREGEGVIRGTRRRTEEQQEVMRKPEARPLRIATMAQLGLIAVLVLTLWLTPVELGWWTLLLSMVAGGVALELVFRLARSGKLRAGSPSLFDPLADLDLLGARGPAKDPTRPPPA